MVASLQATRSQAAVQRIINRLRNHSKRVLITSVKSSPTEAQAVLPVNTAHLPDLRGHFPGNPVVPAITMLEAMFQLAAVLADERRSEPKIDTIKEARFRKIVTPSDGKLLIKVWEDTAGYRGIAEVRNTTVAEALFGE